MSSSVKNDDRLSQVNDNELKKAIEGLDEDEEAIKLSAGANKLTDEVENLIDSDKATVVTIALDMSSSMGQWAPTIQKMFKNQLIPRIENSSEADSIVFQLCTFDSEVFTSGYVKVDEIPYQGYSPDGCTALYDAILMTVNNHIAYINTLKANQLNPKAIYILMTDGENTEQIEATQDHARKAIMKLVAKEETIAYIAFGSNAASEAVALGIPRNQIHEIQNVTEDTFKHIFQIVSKSIIAKSQGNRDVDNILSDMSGTGSGGSSANDAFSQNNNADLDGDDGDNWGF